LPPIWGVTSSVIINRMSSVFLCCNRPQGLGLEDTEEPAGFRRPVDRGHVGLERDFGPDESGGGAFMKLGDSLAASRMARSGGAKIGSKSPIMSQSPLDASPSSVGMSPDGSRFVGENCRLKFSPTNQSTPLSASPTSCQTPAGGSWMGSLGSQMASLGSNLGVQLGTPPSPPTPPGILKNTDAASGSLSGGDSFDSQRRASGSSGVSTVAPRPMSHRGGDITARRCWCYSNTLHA